MSLDDLERAGVTLPRVQWGKRKLRSTVNRPLFLAGAAAAVAADILMYAGDGGVATWAGAVLFMFSLLAVTVTALRAVTKQCHAAVSEKTVNRNQRAPESNA